MATSGPSICNEKIALSQLRCQNHENSCFYCRKSTLVIRMASGRASTATSGAALPAEVCKLLKYVFLLYKLTGEVSKLHKSDFDCTKRWSQLRCQNHENNCFYYRKSALVIRMASGRVSAATSGAVLPAEVCKLPKCLLLSTNSTGWGVKITEIWVLTVRNWF